MVDLSIHFYIMVDLSMYFYINDLNDKDLTVVNYFKPFSLIFYKF